MCSWEWGKNLLSCSPSKHHSPSTFYIVNEYVWNYVSDPAWKHRRVKRECFWAIGNVYFATIPSLALGRRWCLGNVAKTEVSKHRGFSATLLQCPVDLDLPELGTLCTLSSIHGSLLY